MILRAVCAYLSLWKMAMCVWLLACMYLLPCLARAASLQPPKTARGVNTTAAASTVASVTRVLHNSSSLVFAANIAVRDDAGLETIQLQGQLQRPNKMLLTASKSAAPLAVVWSDGLHLYLYSVSTSSFLKTAAPAKGLETGNQTLRRFLRDQLGPAVSSAILTTTETFFGPTVDLSRAITPAAGVDARLTSTQTFAKSGAETNIAVTQHLFLSTPQAPGITFELGRECVVDKATSALRLITLSESKNGQPASLDFRAVFSQFKLSNGPVSTSPFTFALPKTAIAYVAPLGSSEIGDALPPGSTAPNFTVQTSEGRAVKLSDYAGKVIVLDFWATWCPPCLAEMPHTAKLATAYRSKNVVFLPVCDGDSAARFKSWLSHHRADGMTYLFNPNGLDQTSVTHSIYHDDGLPTQFVIGKNGKIVATFVAYDIDDPAETELARAIDVALSAK